MTAARSEERNKTQQYLLQIGALAILERLSTSEKSPVNSVLVKASLALLLGGVRDRNNKLLEVDDEAIINLCDAIDAAGANDEWCVAPSTCHSLCLERIAFVCCVRVGCLSLQFMR